MSRIEKIKNHIKNHSGPYILAALVTGVALGGSRRHVHTDVRITIDEDFITSAFHDMQADAGFKVSTSPDPNTEAGRDLIALIDRHNENQ